MRIRRSLVRWLGLILLAITVALLITGFQILPSAFPKAIHVLRVYRREWILLAFAVALKGIQIFPARRSAEDLAAIRTRRFLEIVDLGSGHLLDGKLVLVLAALATVMIATWLPHYLTWPWCRDEDTFATLAVSWEHGIRPYRDILAYNFPGHIYLHWLIGKVFGWGRTVPFYALDAVAVLILGVGLVIWSRRRLGSTLPGLVAYLAFLDFYLSQEFLQVGERDWHATLLPALALMTVEIWPGRLAIWAAAMLQAAALTIRPHAVFFVPAMISAVAERGAPARSLIEWAIALALCTCVGFSPLLFQGLCGDLLRGLEVASYGGPYSQATWAGAIQIVYREMFTGWTLPLVAFLVGLWLFPSPVDRRLSGTWLLALVAAIFYRAVHPVQHGYLIFPLALIGSITWAFPTAWALSIGGVSRPWRLLIMCTIIAEAVPHVPTYCWAVDSVRAVRSLIQGDDLAIPPPGCRNRWFEPSACAYEWTDYCRALAYLRRTTSTTTEIANVLCQPPFPSINGPVGRLSPFRAESGICWMWLIDMNLDVPFAESLERTPDSVVVWSPPETRRGLPIRLDHVIRVIKRSYFPEARFGAIEVWRRLPVSEKAVE